jgi:Flp pilus assembly protein TadG
MSLRRFLQDMADMADGVARRAHGFRCDTGGNTTIIFALCVIPIFGSVGAAVDYSRANDARTAITVPSQIDARTAAVCANIKAANIKMYVVRVIEGSADLLSGCASTPNMYYDVQVSSQLKDVFASIAASLTGARLSK